MLFVATHHLEFLQRCCYLCFRGTIALRFFFRSNYCLGYFFFLFLYFLRFFRASLLSLLSSIYFIVEIRNLRRISNFGILFRTSEYYILLIFHQLHIKVTSTIFIIRADSLVQIVEELAFRTFPYFWLGVAARLFVRRWFNTTCNFIFQFFFLIQYLSFVCWIRI